MNGSADISEPESEPSEKSVGRKVAKGAALMASTQVIVRLIGLVNTLLLARLLVPEDFGLVALGITAMQILETVSELSVSRTVIRFRDQGREMFDTLFTLSMGKGVLVFIIMACLSVMAPMIYDDERVTAIFLAMGGIALIRSLMNPRFYEFERDIDFTKEFILKILTKLAGVLISITIALIFRSYWAIICGMAVGIFSQVVLSYIFRPFRPNLSLSAFGTIFGFMGWMTATSVLAAINNKLPTLFLGRLIGLAPTGAFYVGEQLASLPGREVATPIIRALYPGLSTLQKDDDRMNEAFLKGSEALAALVLPAAFGLGFIATDATALLLGDQWAKAALVVAVMTPVQGLLAIYGGTQALAMAKGRVRPVFLRELTFLPIQVPFIAIAAYLYGFEGAVWGTALTSLIYMALQMRLYAITTGVKWFKPLWGARRSLVAVGMMSLWFVIGQHYFAMLNEYNVLIRIVIDFICGASIYLVCLLLFWTIEGRPDGIEQQGLNLLKRRAAG